MSRNRCSTSCECGFWYLGTAPHGEVPVDDPGLMTQAEYFAAIDWKDCPYNENGGRSACRGYGYRNDLERGYSMWYSPDGNGSSNAYHPGWREQFIKYTSIDPSDRYRYRKVECPLCHRRYVGWYHQQPKRVGEPATFELYDTSFWDAFNDEPSDADRVGVINWTPDTVARALREFAERHQIEPTK